MQLEMNVTTLHKTFDQLIMKKIIAKRELLYSLKNKNVKYKMVVCIYAPYIVDQNTVDFPIGDGVVGSHVEVEGLEETFQQEVYGVDGIQALNLATDVDPFLKRLSKKYDLYWLSGDPYFED